MAGNENILWLKIKGWISALTQRFDFHLTDPDAHENLFSDTAEAGAVVRAGDDGKIDDSWLRLPWSISRGGTGATTAAQARSNLAVLPITGGTLSGKLYSQMASAGQIQASSSIGLIEINATNAAGAAAITFHISGVYALNFGLDPSSNELMVGGWSMGSVKYTILHTGNWSRYVNAGAVPNASTWNGSSFVRKNGWVYTPAAAGTYAVMCFIYWMDNSGSQYYPTGPTTGVYGADQQIVRYPTTNVNQLIVSGLCWKVG